MYALFALEMYAWTLIRIKKLKTDDADFLDFLY